MNNETIRYEIERLPGDRFAVYAVKATGREWIQNTSSLKNAEKVIEAINRG